MKYSIDIDNQVFLEAKQVYLMQNCKIAQIDNDTIKLIDESIEYLKNTIACSYVADTFDLFFTDNSVYVQEGELLIGKTIFNHLKGAKKAYFFIVTLGVGVDRLINKFQYENMSLCVLIDFISSIIIDIICQKIQDKICNNYEIYERYSCGYGDYSLSCQRNICSVLSSEKIGVSLTNGDMFIPTKTVSAVIGILGEKNV